MKRQAARRHMVDIAPRLPLLPPQVDAPPTARFSLCGGMGLGPIVAWQSTVETMKIKNSLKSLKGRHRANRLVRRKGRIYIINKLAPRYKARQG